MLLYKICKRSDWQEAERSGSYSGSEDDRRDGFIHLSSAAQLIATAAKHFRGKDGLVIVAVDGDRIAGRVKWEPSRGGDLFPHLYAPLDPAEAAWVRDLPLGPGGEHVMPELD
jgi:uncharacterized protein (DUF952 family)